MIIIGERWRVIIRAADAFQVINVRVDHIRVMVLVVVFIHSFSLFP